MTKLYRAIEKYEVAYPNPIKLRIGDEVTITKRETNPDWLGWVFCVDKNGIGGWVSETYLEISQSSARVLKHYDATELALEKGEVVEALYEEFGWAWARNQNLKEGWVPLQNVEAITEQPILKTSRLVLEAIEEKHAKELCELFADPLLHEFVPFEPPTLEQQLERCKRWAKRQSPDGTEIWLNWAARDKESSFVIAHFQSGIKQDGSASIGYVVAREFQGKGYAAEAMEAVFPTLRDQFNVKVVKAWTDSRNIASHKLAKKMGMVQVETIKDADFFKGATSDEFVFAKELK